MPAPGAGETLPHWLSPELLISVSLGGSWNRKNSCHHRRAPSCSLLIGLGWLLRRCLAHRVDCLAQRRACLRGCLREKAGRPHLQTLLLPRAPHEHLRVPQSLLPPVRGNWASHHHADSRRRRSRSRRRRWGIGLEQKRDLPAERIGGEVLGTRSRTHGRYSGGYDHKIDI